MQVLNGVAWCRTAHGPCGIRERLSGCDFIVARPTYKKALIFAADATAVSNNLEIVGQNPWGPPRSETNNHGIVAHRIVRTRQKRTADLCPTTSSVAGSPGRPPG